MTVDLGLASSRRAGSVPLRRCLRLSASEVDGTGKARAPLRTVLPWSTDSGLTSGPHAVGLLHRGRRAGTVVAFSSQRRPHVVRIGGA